MNSDRKFAAAECFGIAALAAVLLGHLLLMGSERASGVGLFLIPITIVGYVVFTWLSQSKPLSKQYWIMYACKIAFIVLPLLFAPIIGGLVQRLVNG